MFFIGLYKKKLLSYIKNFLGKNFYCTWKKNENCRSIICKLITNYELKEYHDVIICDGRKKE